MKHSLIEEVSDWIIVGGGVHGTHLGVRLKMSRVPVTLKMIDPHNSLMQNWKKQTTSTQMTYLRSPAVHNLGIDSFDLLKFAGKKRKNRIRKFSYPYYRPRLSFFNHHCDTLIQKNHLKTSHVQDFVESVHPERDFVRLFTRSGLELRSKKIILAPGQSDKLRVPDWARNKPGVFHIFSSGFCWKKIETAESLAIVGGGISAIQAALYAESLGLKTHIICRHPLRKHQFDSDPGWLGPLQMNNFTFETDYGKRRKIIQESRNPGSIPSELFIAIKGKIHSGRISFCQDEVLRCSHQKETITLSLKDSPQIQVDMILLATGFEPVRPGGDAVDQLIKQYGLSVATCGYPVLAKDLSWHPRIHVSGALAELEIGPVAKNIAGARVAAERIFAGSHPDNRF